MTFTVYAPARGRTFDDICVLLDNLRLVHVYGMNHIPENMDVNWQWGWGKCDETLTVSVIFECSTEEIATLVKLLLG